MEQESDNFQINFHEQSYLYSLQNYLQNKAMIHLMVRILAKLEGVDKDLIFDQINQKMNTWSEEEIEQAKSTNVK
jgi:hypothetical protein